MQKKERTTEWENPLGFVRERGSKRTTTLYYREGYRREWGFREGSRLVVKQGLGFFYLGDTARPSSDLKLGSKLGISWDGVRAKWPEVRQIPTFGYRVAFFVFKVWELVQVSTADLGRICWWRGKFRGNWKEEKQTGIMHVLDIILPINISYFIYLDFLKSYIFHIRIPIHHWLLEIVAFRVSLFGLLLIHFYWKKSVIFTRI